MRSSIVIVVSSTFLSIVSAVELTFELPDSAKECFHEVIEKDTESTLEFQVSMHIFMNHEETFFLIRLLLEVIMM